MFFVRGQNCEASGRRCGGYRDIFEAWSMRSRAIDDRAGVAGFLDTKGKDAARIQVFCGRQPVAQPDGLRRRSDPVGAGNTHLDLGDRYGG